MDSALQELFIGLISNGLTELAVRGKDDGSPPISADSVEAAVRTAVEQLTDIEAISPSLGGEQLREFLRTAETHHIVRQIFASTNSEQIDNVEIEFYELWRARTQGDTSARSEIDRLFRSLVNLCQSSLDEAIARGNLTAIEARAAQRHTELRGAIESLERSLGIFASSPPLNLTAIDDFATKYMGQLVRREGTITPPALDSARQVPIDSLYVPGQLEEIEASSAQTTSYDAFAHTLFRRVVLGNPGSGKSTLAKKLAADLARDKLSLGYHPSGMVPFLVILRDFGAHKRAAKCSLTDFIASTSNSRYQLAPPEGAIEYLLLTNRAMVIFDGLDELLDTSYRAEISGDVESFASLYPSVPILVTSREVGYQQAPLSPETFNTFRLAPFSDTQIKQYARNWFAIDSPEGEADRQADAFMTDSASVADLRSNALMLGLMCNLYKGAGYIPRNRPDVYEACAVMLFDRWDRLRQIGKPLNIESLLRPAMQHLAAWIYTDGELQSGVTEKDLVAKTSAFLLERRFEHKEDAELEAARFIDLCRGRAWVFTDTGTTPAGERLYQFTHRTFLEFFTAAHLVRTNPTPESLLKILQPHISVNEWDVVAQLSFQLLDHNVDGAADVLLSALTAVDTSVEDNQATNCLNFAVRSLEFLVPSPSVTRYLVALACRTLMELLTNEPNVSDDAGPGTRRNQVDTVLALLDANPENARPIGETFVECLADYLFEPGVAVYAAELALNFAVGVRRTETDEQRQLVHSIENRLVRGHRERFQELAESDNRLGTDLLLLGEVDPDFFLTRHGLDSLFHERTYSLFPGTRRVPIAEIVVASLLCEYPGQISEGTGLSILTDLAPHLNPEEFSGIDFHPELGLGSGDWLSSISSSYEARQTKLTDLSGDQVYAALMLLALLFEEPISEERVPIDLGSSPLANAFGLVLNTRSSGKIEGAAQVVRDVALSGFQRDTVLAWAEGKVSLRSRAERLPEL